MDGSPDVLPPCSRARRGSGEADRREHVDIGRIKRAIYSQFSQRSLRPSAIGWLIWCLEQIGERDLQHIRDCGQLLERRVRLPAGLELREVTLRDPGETSQFRDAQSLRAADVPDRPRPVIRQAVLPLSFARIHISTVSDS